MKRCLARHWQKHLMMLPCVIILGLFCYVPMAGIVLAFQEYLPGRGFFDSPWVGMQWFDYMFHMNNFTTVIWNTLRISLLKIFTSQLASVLLALSLNELRQRRLRSLVQGAALFPFFISWVVCGGIFKDLAAEDGLINQGILLVFGTTVPFLTNGTWFKVLLAISNVWKEIGYNTIVIMAALSAIDPALYEASVIDGASRFQKIRYVTLPGVSQIVAMLLILAMGGILGAGFDQVFNLYNACVRKTVDIIDTYVYRMGIQGGLYSLGAAVGLFKSVVGAVLLLLSQWTAKKFAGYQIF